MFGQVSTSARQETLHMRKDSETVRNEGVGTRNDSKVGTKRHGTMMCAQQNTIWKNTMDGMSASQIVLLLSFSSRQAHCYR